MGRGSLRRPMALAAIAATTAVVAACSGGGGGGGGTAGGSSSANAGTPTKGGKLTLLTVQKQVQHLDPQRNYTGVDLAFANGYLQRTLTAYAFGQGAAGTKLVADLATDTGKASNQGKTWTFTLKDGVKFE